MREVGIKYETGEYFVSGLIMSGEIFREVVEILQPMLEKRAHYTRWSQVLGAEFRRLKGMIALQQVSLFSDYGATDPAEFFAVISEVFFEQPERMADEHPELYQQLALFYRLDPLNWTP